MCSQRRLLRLEALKLRLAELRWSPLLLPLPSSKASSSERSHQYAAMTGGSTLQYASYMDELFSTKLNAKHTAVAARSPHSEASTGRGR